MDQSCSMARLPLCNHLLQHTLRGVCAESEWVYSVFWRILPRSFPPPKWELGGYLDRSKANKRNWILVWEDGFCDFRRTAAEDVDASTSSGQYVADDQVVDPPSNKRATGNDQSLHISSGRRLHPELFFKMSHELYNYGEGLMGKIAADNGHKWIYRDPPERDNRLVSFWHNTIDPQPRIWEAQFKNGIQTIVVVAVREGLVQLGSTRQVLEDLNFVMLLQRKFNSLQPAACPAAAQVQQPASGNSLASAALQSMLSPDLQLTRRRSNLQEQRKGLKRLAGQPDVVQQVEELPGFTTRTQQLERRLSWSNSGDSMMRAPGLSQVQHLDLLNNVNAAASSLSPPDLSDLQQINEQHHIRLPLAHDVQAAADHLSQLTSCVSANCTLVTSATASTNAAQDGVAAAAPARSMQGLYHIPCNFRVNPSLPQAGGSATTAGSRMISVLPCISDVQAHLSSLPAVACSTSNCTANPAGAVPVGAHVIIDNEKSALLLNRSPLARTLSAPAPVLASATMAPLGIFSPCTTSATVSASSATKNAAKFQRLVIRPGLQQAVQQAEFREENMSLLDTNKDSCTSTAGVDTINYARCTSVDVAPDMSTSSGLDYQRRPPMLAPVHRDDQALLIMESNPVAAALLVDGDSDQQKAAAITTHDHEFEQTVEERQPTDDGCNGVLEVTCVVSALRSTMPQFCSN